MEGSIVLLLVIESFTQDLKKTKAIYLKDLFVKI